MHLNTKPNSCFVVLTVIIKILDRLAYKGIGTPFTDIISLGLLAITIWLVLQVQVAINYACRDPDGESNSKLTGLNYIWMGLGSILWGLIILGLLIVFGVIEQ